MNKMSDLASCFSSPEFIAECLLASTPQSLILRITDLEVVTKLRAWLRQDTDNIGTLADFASDLLIDVAHRGPGEGKEFGLVACMIALQDVAAPRAESTIRNVMQLYLKRKGMWWLSRVAQILFEQGVGTTKLSQVMGDTEFRHNVSDVVLRCNISDSIRYTHA